MFYICKIHYVYSYACLTYVKHVLNMSENKHFIHVCSLYVYYMCMKYMKNICLTYVKHMWTFFLCRVSRLLHSIHFSSLPKY